MREITIRPGDVINLGRQGENNALRVRFCVSGWAEAYGSGTFSLIVQTPDGTAYDADVTASGDQVLWIVPQTVTGQTGQGVCQLNYLVNGGLARSEVYRTIVTTSVGPVVGPASDAEAWAVGERNGVPVFPGDPTYHNNSKYYAEDSAANAQQAAESAELAADREDAATRSAAQAMTFMERAADAAYRAEAFVGAPLTASTAADMTDVYRIYVYVGTTIGTMVYGHWYFWDGSVWADGGVYNSSAEESDLLKNQIYNAYDVWSGRLTKTTGTSNGVTYTWNGDTCTVTGKATSYSANIILASSNLPTDVIPGHTYFLRYKRTAATQNLAVRFTFKNSGGTTIDTQYPLTDAQITIPEACTAWAIALYCSTGADFATPSVITELALLNALPNSEIYSKESGTDLKDYLDNQIDALSSVTVPTVDYEIGSFNESGNETVSNRVRSGYLYVDRELCTITFPETLEVRVGVWSSTAPLVFDRWENNWENRDIAIPGGEYIRILVRFKDTAHSMTADDVSYIANNVSVAFKSSEQSPFIQAYDEPVETMTWTIGGLNLDGTNSTATNRLRSTWYIYTPGNAETVVTVDDPLEMRVAVYDQALIASFSAFANTWGTATPTLPTNKYIRLLLRYSDNRTITSDMIPDMVELVHVEVKWDKHQDRYSKLKGKTVAILGDSISTTGWNYYSEESNVPEIIIQPEDVGIELKAFLTFRDFHPIGGGVQTITLGGQTYTYNDADASPTGTEITFTPTQADVGKKVGVPENHNPATMRVWWQFAKDVLGFIPVNASYSGSCICRARDSMNDVYDDKYYHGSFAWNLSQIRRCGRRIPGSMKRVSPDVIIIYRGTNDFGSRRNGVFPPISTEIFDRVQDLESYIVQDYDKVGVVPGRSSGESAKDLYSFVLGYFLTVLRLQKAYPFSHIFLCTIQDIRRAVKDGKYPVRNTDNTLAQWNHAIRVIAENMNCGVIDFARDGTNFFNYSTYLDDPVNNDGVHPGQDGQIILGNRAIADLMAQYNPMNFPSIQWLMDNDDIVPYDEEHDPEDPPQYGPGEGVLEKIKFRAVWDGFSTIGSETI